MGIEFELKFQAEPELQEAVRQAYPGQEFLISMETTYYDTPDHKLSAQHITLRRRLENGISICTIKTPGGAAGRGEWECFCEDISLAVPMLCKLGCPQELAYLAEVALVPICGARFTRQAKTISLESGTIELALDKGFLLGGSKEQPLCEIEVEQKTASREETQLFAQVAASRFGLVPESASKFARARALAGL